MIRCSECTQGKLTNRVVRDHDVSALVGLDGAKIERATALVCNHCGAVSLEGEVIEAALQMLARLIVEQGEELRPREVRFLRTELGLRQEDLAARLGVSRATVARWETGNDPIGRAASLALRSLVAWKLGDAKLARAISEIDRPMSLAEVPYRVAV